MNETQDDRIVCIVDDDEAMRDALDALLSAVGLRVETYDSAAGFLESFDSERIGCLLLDVRMPGMSGIDLQRHLSEKFGFIPILLISGHADVTMAVEAMKRGAVDFIEKPIEGGLLVERVQKCLRHDAERRREQAMRDELRSLIENLTAREREVAELIAEGLPNKTIASQLGISVKTLDVHRSHILAKLKLRTNAELVRVMLAARLGS